MKRGPKILFGAILLSSAVSVLSFFKNEEKVTNQEIVRVESSPRKNSKVMEQLEERREEVEEKVDEVEELINEIKKIEFFFSEERVYPIPTLAYYEEKMNEMSIILNTISGFSEEKREIWFAHTNKSLGNTSKEVKALFAGSVSEETLDEFSSTLGVSTGGKTQDHLFHSVLNTVLRFVKGCLESVEEVRAPLEKIVELNKRLLRLSESEQNRGKVKVYTEKMEGLNEKALSYLDELDRMNEFLKGKERDVRREIKAHKVNVD
ncbi:MAG: hypothetical protein WC595_01855 [Candidatus Nanoarchaeia archaeon]